MASFAPRDVHIPIDGQTVITLLHPYVVGASELMVYLNGLLVIDKKDYDETNNLHITFRFQLSANDVVITQHLVYFDTQLVQVISDTGNSLFQKYGTEKRLLANQKYEFNLQYDGTSMQSTFFTLMTPMYSSVASIRADLGDFIGKITDYQIMYLIYENSIMARFTFIDDFSAITNFSDLSSLDPAIQFKIKQFVRYTTGLDLATQIFLILMGQSGGDHIVLGQLEIEKRFNLGDVKSLLALLKAKLTKYSRVKSPVRAAVKGKNFVPATAAAGYPLQHPRMGFSVTIGGRA